jgi:hypothetical protein
MPAVLVVPLNLDTLPLLHFRLRTTFAPGRTPLTVTTRTTMNRYLPLTLKEMLSTHMVLIGGDFWFREKFISEAAPDTTITLVVRLS